MRLTKSEFMLGRTCLTKVQHLRNGLESVKDDNSFVEELSGVGAIVHWIAPQLYGNIVASNLSITDILPGAYGTYVEVTVPALTKQARIDILRYTESGIKLVEVKSKCYPVDTTEHDGLPTVAERSGDPAKWRDLIDDICFQYVTLIEAKAEGIVPIMDEESIPTAELVLLNPFVEGTEAVLRQRFSTDPETGAIVYDGTIDDLAMSNLLVPVEVTMLVSERLGELYAEANTMISALEVNPQPILDSRCAACEYRLPKVADETSGFVRCWGTRALDDAFVLDLTEVGRLHKINGINAIEHLVLQGKHRMTDLAPAVLSNRFNNRQHRQIKAAVSGDPIIDSALQSTLQKCQSPHVFIDVEAVSSGLPYWPNSRPFEITTFQWSAHTLERPLADGGTYEHHEWLHESKHHPCMAFLTSLRERCHMAGTIYIWSPYERTAVKHAHAVALRMGISDSATQEWVHWFLDKTNPHIVDMLDLARRYYMHPDMRGSASIKSVLPPIWRENSDVRRHFPHYVRFDGDHLTSPYATLPSLDGIANLSDVRDGTAAIVAYASLIHNSELSAEERNSIRNALLEYCKLDTAAMVIIHQAWLAHGVQI